MDSMKSTFFTRMHQQKDQICIHHSIRIDSILFEHRIRKHCKAKILVNEYMSAIYCFSFDWFSNGNILTCQQYFCLYVYVFFSFSIISRYCCSVHAFMACGVCGIWAISNITKYVQIFAHFQQTNSCERRVSVSVSVCFRLKLSFIEKYSLKSSISESEAQRTIVWFYDCFDLVHVFHEVELIRMVNPLERIKQCFYC